MTVDAAAATGQGEPRGSAAPRPPAAPYAFLPHTADLRVALRAETLPGLYHVAADVVRHLLVGDEVVEPREERPFELPDEEPERFFRFVRELVYLFDAERFLVARVLPGAPVRVWGERFDPTRHHAERQLKAVTRHGFALLHDAAGYRCELVFDV
jgi:SHS2 domain-containing protein